MMREKKRKKEKKKKKVRIVGLNLSKFVNLITHMNIYFNEVRKSPTY